MQRLRIGLVVLLVVAGLAATTRAQAAGPQHFHVQFPEERVDTTTCAFSIVFSFVFTNDVTAFFDDSGVIQSLQLHQSRVGTVVGNGVTLKEDEHTQTFVTFTGGSATQAVHVGTILHLVGPSGRLAEIAGQRVFEVENGFDHTLISEHGLDFDFASDAAVCAAFS
jgi:hypothetical protein